MAWLDSLQTELILSDGGTDQFYVGANLPAEMISAGYTYGIVEFVPGPYALFDSMYYWQAFNANTKQWVGGYARYDGDGVTPPVIPVQWYPGGAERGLPTNATGTDFLDVGANTVSVYEQMVVYGTANIAGDGVNGTIPVQGQFYSNGTLDRWVKRTVTGTGVTIVWSQRVTLDGIAETRVNVTFTTAPSNLVFGYSLGTGYVYPTFPSGGDAVGSIPIVWLGDKASNVREAVPGFITPSQVLARGELGNPNGIKTFNTQFMFTVDKV